jgi:uncharacterized membrane protein
VRRILDTRCVSCHAMKPTQPGFAVAPKGLVLETDEQVLAKLPLLATQVASRAMPIGNLTAMTDDERMELLGWIQDGAPR